MEYRLRRLKIHWAENKAYIRAHRQHQPCRICGCIRDDHDFHHLDPTLKCFSIFEGYNRPRYLLAREITKCALLCHKCHFKLHRDLDAGLTPAIIHPHPRWARKQTPQRHPGRRGRNRKPSVPTHR